MGLKSYCYINILLYNNSRKKERGGVRMRSIKEIIKDRAEGKKTVEELLSEIGSDSVIEFYEPQETDEWNAYQELYSEWKKRKRAREEEARKKFEEEFARKEAEIKEKMEKVKQGLVFCNCGHWAKKEHVRKINGKTYCPMCDVNEISY
jgi:formylmethanofuran dehydrogenase subunit E